MACPGGCIGGGGQPKPTSEETRKARTKLIYEEDKNLPFRKSHENPEVKKIYEAFFEAPLSHKSHKYLHTHYHAHPVDYSKFIDMADMPTIKAHIKSMGFP